MYNKNMSIINISLPVKLKSEAQLLVDEGYFSSFSDLVRTALRDLLQEMRLSQLANTAKKDYYAGEFKDLTSKEEVEKYIKSLSKSA